MSKQKLAPALVGLGALVLAVGCDAAGDGEAQAAADTAAVQAAPPPVAAGPLPIRTGLWSGDCTDLTEAILYDGRRIGYLIGGDAIFWEPVGPVAVTGTEHFLENHDMLIKPLGSDRLQLTIQDDAILNLCPQDQLRADVSATVSRLLATE